MLAINDEALVWLRRWFNECGLISGPLWQGSAVDIKVCKKNPENHYFHDRRWPLVSYVCDTRGHTSVRHVFGENNNIPLGLGMDEYGPEIGIPA